MDSEPGWLRVVRAFFDEQDDVDNASGVVSCISDIRDVSSMLFWNTRLFSVLRGTAGGTTVVVPEGLHDPEARGMREVVWAEAQSRDVNIKMDNVDLLRIATQRPRGTPIDRRHVNSRETRVLPVFRWLRENGGPGWADTLVATAEGLAHVPRVGPVLRVHLERELRVAASPRRLRWMLSNGARLAPSDGRRWRELGSRTARMRGIAAVDACLAAGVTLPASLTLEGATSGDCVIEGEDAVIWIEGKRHDWLAPHTTWDTARDQLARNLEAAWLHASAQSKDFCLIVCSEDRLHYHEQLLVDGYRNATWSGGWPHLDPSERAMLGERIATSRWSDLARAWPALMEIPELIDLNAGGDS